MISKPEEHETNRAGKRLLRDTLEPLGWVVNDVQEDYGIDCNVQVFEGKSPTGAWFHVQLKSTAAPSYSTDGSFLSQELSADHARHFAVELKDPVFLVVADVSSKMLYWHSPQLDGRLLSSLKREDARSVTIRVPTRQRLPDTASEILNSLSRIYLVLSTRKLTSASAPSFASSLKHFPDQNELFAAFQKKNDILKLQRVRDFYVQNQIPEARERASAILNDPDSDVEAKFWAVMVLQTIEFRQTLFDGKAQIELANVMIAHAKLFKKVTRSGPKHLKFYAAIASQAAQLDFLVHEHSGLFQALAQHLAYPTNPSTLIVLSARKLAATKRVVSAYNRCIRLAQYAATYPDRWVLGRALTQVVNSISRYLVTLRYENAEAEVAFATSALQICRLSAWISSETKDPEGVVMAILGALATTQTTDSDAYRWAVELADGIRDPDVQKDAKLCIERATKRWKGEHVEGDYHGNAVWQIVQNVACSLGIDISNEAEPLVKGLRIAAKDNSPERVLRTCEHIVVSQGAIGPTALRIQRIFNIGTAGSKVVHCSLHDQHHEGRDLYSAYEEFRRQHCDPCSDNKPRSSDWHYKGQVREEFEARHRDFVTRLYGTEYGLRFTDQD